jgi:hypothetical protein
MALLGTRRPGTGAGGNALIATPVQASPLSTIGPAPAASLTAPIGAVQGTSLYSSPVLTAVKHPSLTNLGER